MGVRGLRQALIAAIGITAALTPTAAATAGGRPFLAVQHTLTNGVFATAEWQTQTQSRSSDVAVSVVQPRQGAPILDVSGVYDRLDPHGVTTGQTLIVTDTSRGFRFGRDHTGLGWATLTGRVAVTICRYPAGACVPATASISVTWTGEGPVTRGAVTGLTAPAQAGHGSLYLFDEHLSGSGRAATSAGALAGHALDAATLSSAAIGTVHSGSIFVCLNDGCEN